MTVRFLGISRSCFPSVGGFLELGCSVGVIGVIRAFGGYDAKIQSFRIKEHDTTDGPVLIL